MKSVFCLCLLLAGAVASRAADLGTALPGLLPSTWRVAPRPELPQRFTDGRNTLAVLSQPTGDGPAAFAQHCLDDLQRIGDGFEVVSFEFATALGNRTWSRIRYKLRLLDKTKVQELWTTVDAGQGWCLTVGGDGDLEPAAAMLAGVLRRLP